MRRVWLAVAIVAALALTGCGYTENQERADSRVVADQQAHYAKVHPIPYFEYSIPRDVLIQIYEVVTTKAYGTYTVIQSMTGEVVFHGPSVGYGIPVDSQLTNPLQPYRYSSGGTTSVVIEQAEPSGLFSSKNTDGTWVLFVFGDGEISPIYTEQKVTTFPFPVVKTSDGWVRAEGSKTQFTIELGQ